MELGPGRTRFHGPVHRTPARRFTDRPLSRFIVRYQPRSRVHRLFTIIRKPTRDSQATARFHFPRLSVPLVSSGIQPRSTCPRIVCCHITRRTGRFAMRYSDERVFSDIAFRSETLRAVEASRDRREIAEKSKRSRREVEVEGKSKRSR